MDSKHAPPSDVTTPEELLAELTRSLTKSTEEFQASFPHYFLLRRPKTLLISEVGSEAEQAFEYRTTSLPVPGDGLHPWQWWVAAVSKRKGHAFPNRLAVGRADSCDVQLRFRFVSKLHARFHLEGGIPTSLEDAGSSNGTFVNGQRISAGQSLKVRSGDRIGFGALTVELLSPAACQTALRARQDLLATRPGSP